MIRFNQPTFVGNEIDYISDSVRKKNMWRWPIYKTLFPMARESI